MSMNIYISGVRNAEVVVKGKRKMIKDVVEFNAWQTPTSVTFDILEFGTNEGRINEYITWVTSQECSDIVYDADAGQVVRVNNLVDRHLSEFREWLIMCEAEGYQVKFQMI